MKRAEDSDGPPRPKPAAAPEANHRPKESTTMDLGDAGSWACGPPQRAVWRRLVLPAFEDLVVLLRCLRRLQGDGEAVG